MLRVLQVNTVFDSGSTGRIAACLLAAVKQSGGHGWVAYGRGPIRDTAEALRIGDAVDVAAHGLQSRLLDQHGLGSRSATRRLLARVNRLNPSLVHLHNIHGYYLNYEILFDWLKSRSLPVVWTLHDCWAFTGHCTYYDYVDCQRWKQQCGQCPQLNAYPASWVVDASARNLERKRQAFRGLNNLTLVTPSAWLAGEVGQSLLNRYRTLMIKNGIDQSAFAPTASQEMRNRLGIGPKAPVVLGVASDFSEPRKGLRYLVQLAGRLPSGARMVLVGVPKQELSRLPTGVVGLARTDSLRDLAALYSMASVFVNPTLEDNSPSVMIEAQACGTPVVTFATGGCPELLTGQTGTVVPRGDVAALSDAVERAIERGKEPVASACRALAFEHSNKSMAESYMKLYRELIGR